MDDVDRHNLCHRHQRQRRPELRAADGIPMIGQALASLGRGSTSMSISTSMSMSMSSIERFLRDEEGQDVVEYGLLIATIAIVVLAAVGLFGSEISAWFGSLAKRITTTGTA